MCPFSGYRMLMFTQDTQYTILLMVSHSFTKQQWWSGQDNAAMRQQRQGRTGRLQPGEDGCKQSALQNNLKDAQDETWFP